jgi:hypothetical protein
MSARDSIENTLSQYAWAFDMQELEVMGDCFTVDTQTTFGDTGLKVGREVVAAEMIRRRSLYAADETPWHVLSNVYIASQQDALATVKTFFTFIVVKPGEPLNVRGVGYYDDVFRDDGDRWRIHERSVMGLNR